MSALPVIAIFDIGRTHKKFMLFDQEYRVVEERSIAIRDITDDDGDPCEDLQRIAAWMLEQMHIALTSLAYDIKAINFSAHGASLVHINAATGDPVTPLYDYMKAIPGQAIENFYSIFGGKRNFSQATGSPALGMLNSGIQLYWLKNYKPDQYAQISTSLHLPQYGNYLFSGKMHADISSIGCHTGLWDFEKQQYHAWVHRQQVADKLPDPEPVTVFDHVKFDERNIPVGIGLHDSSAALLPFVYTADEPFVLLSSGTWNITLNPFFDGDLSEEDYEKDCLYYLLDIDRKVAASRLFLGNEYQHQVSRLEDFFQKHKGYYTTVVPDQELFEKVISSQSADSVFYPETMAGTGPFPQLKAPSIDLDQFSSFDEAYHKLMLDLTYLQKISLELVCRNIKRLYISGGFVQTHVFMELLHAFLPGWQIFIAENKRASALGAAVAMHDVWQKRPLSGTVSPVIPFKPQLHLNVDKYHSYFEAQSITQ
jgi:sugar (pentulose or hexulose) kinase